MICFLYEAVTEIYRYWIRDRAMHMQLRAAHLQAQQPDMTVIEGIHAILQRHRTGWPDVADIDSEMKIIRKAIFYCQCLSDIQQRQQALQMTRVSTVMPPEDETSLQQVVQPLLLQVNKHIRAAEQQLVELSEDQTLLLLAERALPDDDAGNAARVAAKASFTEALPTVSGVFNDAIMAKRQAVVAWIADKLGLTEEQDQDSTLAEWHTQMQAKQAETTPDFELLAIQALRHVEPTVKVTPVSAVDTALSSGPQSRLLALPWSATSTLLTSRPRLLLDDDGLEASEASV